MNRIRNIMLKATTWFALFVMALCVCVLDLDADITPVMTVFFVCMGWVVLFLVANREYLW